MEKLKTSARVVLDFMIKNNYSQHSLCLYEKVLNTLEDHFAGK